MRPNSSTTDPRRRDPLRRRRLAAAAGVLLFAGSLVVAPGAWAPAGAGAAEPVAGFTPTWAVTTSPSDDGGDGFAVDFLGNTYLPSNEPGVLVQRIGPTGAPSGELAFTGSGTVITRAIAVDRDLDLVIAGVVTGSVVVGTGAGAATLDGGAAPGTSFVMSWNRDGFANWVQTLSPGSAVTRLQTVEGSVVLIATFEGSITIDGVSATGDDRSTVVASLDASIGTVNWLTPVVASAIGPAEASIADLSVDEGSVAVVGRLSGYAASAGTIGSAPVTCPPEGDYEFSYDGCSFAAELDLATGEPLVARPFEAVNIIVLGVAQSADGLVVSGFVDDPGIGPTGFLAELDTAGDPLWYESFRGMLGTSDLEIDSRGDIVLAEGIYESTVHLGSGPDAPVIPGGGEITYVIAAEFDASGTLLRHTTVVGPANPVPMGSTVDLLRPGLALGANDEIVLRGYGEAPIAFGSGPDAVTLPGNGSWLASFAPDIPATGSVFEPVAPARLLDSRTATGGWNGPLVAGSPRPLVVAGANGVPADASAVVVNLTVTNVSDMTYLTAWPTGVGQPTASTLNADPGDTIANLATVQVGVGGTITLATSDGSTDVVADLLGYYRPGDAGNLFHPVTPARVLDSRTSTGGWNSPLVAGTDRDLVVAGAGGVPVDATAVTLSVTATDTTQDTYLQVRPTGTSTTNSNLNIDAGQTITNLVTVQLGTGGALTFTNNTGSINVVADVVGFYDEDMTGSRFIPVSPARVLDTRTGTGGYVTPFDADTERPVAVAPPGSTITAVVANLTATDVTQETLLTLYPGPPRPATSNLLAAAGQTIAAGATTGVAADGTVSVFNKLGSANVILDVNGYFVAPEPLPT